MYSKYSDGRFVSFEDVRSGEGVFVTDVPQVDGAQSVAAGEHQRVTGECECEHSCSMSHSGCVGGREAEGLCCTANAAAVDASRCADSTTSAHIPW